MGRKLLFAKTKITLVTQAMYILESVTVLTIYIFKGETMKKKIAVLLLLAFVLSTFNTNQVQASQKDNGKGVTTDEIKDIIENPENYSDDTMSKSEVNEFLTSKNPNALIGKTEEEIAEYFATVNTYCGSSKPDIKGGQILNPVYYLYNTVGGEKSEYKRIDTKIISGAGAHTCEQFGGGNNCTLTALYNVMVYYRDKKGYKKIPKVVFKVYYPIKNQATALGYTEDSGLDWWKNDNLVTLTWRKGFKYTSGTGYIDVFWTSDKITDTLDNDQPFMLSLASGYYFNHTVTVIGYTTYKSTKTNKKYSFLLIKDGYSGATRYLPFTGNDESYVACMTTMLPPGKF